MTSLSRVSIRLRIAVSSAAIAAVVLSALAVLVALQVHAAAVTSASQLALDDLRPYRSDLLNQSDERPDVASAGVLVLVVTPRGAVARTSMPSGLAGAARGVRSVASVRIAAGEFRIVRMTVRTSSGVWQLWSARDLTASNALMSGILLTALAGVPIAVLLTAVAAWVVVAAALRPVHRMRAAAELLRAPGSEGRLPEQGAGELADLGATLNGLITDLRAHVSHEQRLTADAAHELRTPLAVLAAQVEIARRAPHRADLPGIHESVSGLTRLTDDLLTLSRLDTASARTGRATVAELVTETMTALDLLRLLAPPAVTVDLELGGRLDGSGHLHMDVTSWGRVLRNLTRNAIAATPAGAITIRLVGTLDALLLDVLDEGRGVPVSFLPSAFDRFSRPLVGSTATVAGAGLGLALVKGLAEQAGGTVRLENRASGGAIASLSLPIDHGSDADPGPSETFENSNVGRVNSQAVIG